MQFRTDVDYPIKDARGWYSDLHEWRCTCGATITQQRRIWGPFPSSPKAQVKCTQCKELKTFKHVGDPRNFVRMVPHIHKGVNNSIHQTLQRRKVIQK